LPRASAVTPLDSPETLTGVDRTIPVDPSPSWPKKPSPQHLAAPPVVVAHGGSRPAATALAPLARPATSTGATSDVLELSPSWPLKLFPQHSSRPVVITAQTW